MNGWFRPEEFSFAESGFFLGSFLLLVVLDCRGLYRCGGVWFFFFLWDMEEEE